MASEVPQANTVLTLNDMIAVCDAAIGGHGLVQLPTYIATPALRAGLRAPVLADVESAPAQVMLHYPARPLTPARVRVVVDFLFERLHAHPDLTFDPRALGTLAIDGCGGTVVADRSPCEGFGVQAPSQGDRPTATDIVGATNSA